MSDRRWISLPLALLALLAAGRPASACGCLANSPKFDQVARKAALVVVGRIIALGATKDDPDSIELEVVWTAKGTSPAPLRVWNEVAGTSCGGAFRNTPIGTHLLVALERVGDVKPRTFWDILKFRAPDGDYLLADNPCGQSFTILRTEQDVAKWMGQSIK